MGEQAHRGFGGVVVTPNEVPEPDPQPQAYVANEQTRPSPTNKEGSGLQAFEKVRQLWRQEPECEMTGRVYPLVPAGRYGLRFQHHETFVAFRGSPKLVLWFKIADPGELFGVLIPRFYNVKDLVAKPRRGGRFRAGRGSNFVMDYCRLFPEAVGRLDRLSLDPFRHYALVGIVETVKANSAQRELPAALAYSVIREFERFRP